MILFFIKIHFTEIRVRDFFSVFFGLWTHDSETKDFPIHIIVMSRILLINSIFSLITMFYKYIVPNSVIFRFYFTQKKNKFQNKKLGRIRRIFFFLSIVLKIIFFPEIKIQKEYSLFDICRIKKIE